MRIFPVVRKITLFVPENDGSDSGDARFYIIDDFPDLRREFHKVDFHLRAGSNDGHIPEQHIHDLGDLVDFGFPQKGTHGSEPPVFLYRNAARSETGTGQKHGGKLPDPEFFVLIPDPVLKIKDITLTGELQEQRDGNEKRKKNDYRNKRNQQVEKAFGKFVHAKGLRVASC